MAQSYDMFTSWELMHVLWLGPKGYYGMQFIRLTCCLPLVEYSVLIRRDAIFLSIKLYLVIESTWEYVTKISILADFSILLMKSGFHGQISGMVRVLAGL